MIYKLVSSAKKADILSNVFEYIIDVNFCLFA